MNENEMNGMEGMEEDVIVFEDEDGQEYEFSVVDYFFYNGEEYALLTENGTEGDLVLKGGKLAVFELSELFEIIFILSFFNLRVYILYLASELSDFSD